MLGAAPASAARSAVGSRSGWAGGLSFGLGGGARRRDDHRPPVRARKPALAADPRPADEAEPIMADIERHAAGRQLPPVGEDYDHARRPTSASATSPGPWSSAIRRRAFLGLVLIASQAFFYNGISFSYPLVLQVTSACPRRHGRLRPRHGGGQPARARSLLGHFFDTLRPSRDDQRHLRLRQALIIIGAELLFLHDQLTADTQTLLWAVTFFFASAAASCRLPDGERDLSARDAGLGDCPVFRHWHGHRRPGAPALFGHLIASGHRDWLVSGYFIGAGLMLAAALSS